MGVSNHTYLSFFPDFVIIMMYRALRKLLHQLELNNEIILFFYLIKMYLL